MSRHGGYDRSALLAELYDLVPAYTAREDLAFYLAEARRSGGPVLELGCGTGRVLAQLAEAGIEMVGLDLSRYMLDRCRRRVAGLDEEARHRVRLVRGDMIDFDLGERFPLVTTPFRSFQHLLSIPDQLACLECCRRHLLPGGRLILEFFQTDPRRLHDPVFLEETETLPATELPDGRRLRRTERCAAFHRAAQINDVELIYHLTHLDGRTERIVQAFPFRYFFRYEVEHLLARCGFQVVELYGDFDGSPLTASSPEMIFVARAAPDSEDPSEDL